MLIAVLEQLVDWKAGERMEALKELTEKEGRLLSWDEMSQREGLVQQLVRAGFERKDD